MLPPPSEDTRVAELTRRVENLEAALRAAFTTISGGRGLVVNGGGGITIADGGQLRVQYPAEEGGEVGVFFGDINAVGTGEYQGTGLLIQDPDGTDIAMFRSDAATGNPVVVLRDAQENAVICTDFNSGQGLLRPLGHVAFYPVRPADYVVSTTSTSFETLWAGEYPKEHSGLTVSVRGYGDASDTTGEVRVLAEGALIGAAQSVNFSGALRTFGPGVVDGVHEAYVYVEIQARRTAGTGGVRVVPERGIPIPV